MKSFEYKVSDLMNPCLLAFHKLGGSATNAEIEEEVINILKLSDEEVNDNHRGNVTKLNYRLRWARNYLKRAGILENSSRGVWALTEVGQRLKQVNHKEVDKMITALDAAMKKELKDPTEENQDELEELN